MDARSWDQFLWDAYVAMLRHHTPEESERIVNYMKTMHSDDEWALTGARVQEALEVIWEQNRKNKVKASAYSVMMTKLFLYAPYILALENKRVDN